MIELIVLLLLLLGLGVVTTTALPQIIELSNIWVPVIYVLIFAVLPIGIAFMMYREYTKDADISSPTKVGIAVMMFLLGLMFSQRILDSYKQNTTALSWTPVVAFGLAIPPLCIIIATSVLAMAIGFWLMGLIKEGKRR